MTQGRAGESSLHRHSGTTLHRQVFAVMKDHILTGQPGVGEPLPSESELSELYGVSRATIRNAMAALERENLIERRQGVGTFVANHVAATPLHSPISDLMAHLADVDRTTTLRLIEYDYIRAPPNVCDVFKCHRDAIFQRAVRLRLIDTRPAFHVVSFIPQSIAKDLTAKDLESKSIYKLLGERGVQVHSGKQIVSAQLADPVVAALLEISIGAPLIQIRRQYSNTADEVVEYAEILASTAMFELHMTIDPDSLNPLK